MQTVASRKLRKLILPLVLAYEGVFLTVYAVVHRMHLTGALLVALAVLPVLPIVALFGSFGRYLRDETDGYKRELAIRCVLWGTAAVLSMEYFVSMLRIFDWKGQVPPFCELGVFFLFTLIAKLSYRAANRVPADA